MIKHKKWKKQEWKEHGVKPGSKKWLEREMKEPWHKSLKAKKVNPLLWLKEEKKEHKGRK